MKFRRNKFYLKCNFDEQWMKNYMQYAYCEYIETYSTTKLNFHALIEIEESILKEYHAKPKDDMKYLEFSKEEYMVLFLLRFS